jgi:hypothetical protein
MLAPVGVLRCHARSLLPMACMLLLVFAAARAELIRIVSPLAPSVGSFTCKSRVLHVRVAITSSFSDHSAQVAILVDGQQLLLAPARLHAEVALSSPL